MEYIHLTREQCYKPLDKFYRMLFEMEKPEYFKGIPRNLLAERQRDIIFYKDKIGISFWALREIWRYYQNELDAIDEEILRIFHQFAPSIELDDDDFIVSVEDGWWFDINFQPHP